MVSVRDNFRLSNSYHLNDSITVLNLLEWFPAEQWHWNETIQLQQIIIIKMLVMLYGNVLSKSARLFRLRSGISLPISHLLWKSKPDVCASRNKTPIYQVPPPPPQPVPIIKNPVIRKLQEETLPSLSITSSIEQDSVLGMDRRPEKEGNALFYPWKVPN